MNDELEDDELEDDMPRPIVFAVVMGIGMILLGATGYMVSAHYLSDESFPSRSFMVPATVYRLSHYECVMWIDVQGERKRVGRVDDAYCAAIK